MEVQDIPSVSAEPAFGSLPLVERRRVPRESVSRKILGLQFFTGTVQQAVDRMRRGGLVVVPAAPALIEMQTNSGYRDALMGADMILPDSAFMVMIWNRLRRVKKIHRLSGLEYLRVLLMQSDTRAYGNTLWIMAGERSAKLNLDWLLSEGIRVRKECIYNAPMYGKGTIEDPKLLALIEEQKPQHVIVTLGGGNQERLGLYLRQNLNYMPAIHCIGAAIAFLSGDQVHIPEWADKFYLGWLFRSISEPARYAPRYWAARKLLPILLRYRSELPPFIGAS